MSFGAGLIGKIGAGLKSNITSGAAKTGQSKSAFAQGLFANLQDDEDDEMSNIHQQGMQLAGFQLSDKRLKKNIRRIKTPMAKVRKMKGGQ